MFLFGYFIPGVRHVTAIIAGSAETKYSKFALFAYSGGLIWVLTYITIGFTVGGKWMILIEQIQNYILITSLIAFILLLIIFIVKKKKFYQKIIPYFLKLSSINIK